MPSRGHRGIWGGDGRVQKQDSGDDGKTLYLPKLLGNTFRMDEFQDA